MRPPAEILSMLISSGLSPQQIALVAEYGLASVAAVSEHAPPSPALTDNRSPSAVRQQRYRDRQKDQAVTRDVTRDVTNHNERDVNRNVVTPLARGLDNPLTVVVSGVVGGVGGDAGVTPPKPSADDWPPGDAKQHADLLVQLAASPWLDPMKAPGLVTTAGRVAAWRRSGASWLNDVIPVVQGVCARQRQRINGWKFFDDAVSRSIAENLRALEIPEAQGRPAHERPDPRQVPGTRTPRARMWAEATALERGARAGGS